MRPCYENEMDANIFVFLTCINLNHYPSAISRILWQIIFFEDFACHNN